MRKVEADQYSMSVRMIMSIYTWISQRSRDHAKVYTEKVEVDGGAELTEDFLHSEIHPVITINIITIHHCHQHNFKRLLGSWPIITLSANFIVKSSRPSSSSPHHTKNPPPARWKAWTSQSLQSQRHQVEAQGGWQRRRPASKSHCAMYFKSYNVRK